MARGDHAGRRTSAVAPTQRPNAPPPRSAKRKAAPERASQFLGGGSLQRITQSFSSKPVAPMAWPAGEQAVATSAERAPRVTARRPSAPRASKQLPQGEAATCNRRSVDEKVRPCSRIPRPRKEQCQRCSKRRGDPAARQRTAGPRRRPT